MPSNDYRTDPNMINRGIAIANQKRRLEREALARTPRPPAEVMRLDLNMARCEKLLLAAKMADGKPGSIRRNYENVALPLAMIGKPQTGAPYWTKMGKAGSDPSPFDAHFGFPGNIVECRESCGLAGHLFDDETAHDRDNLVNFVKLWIADTKTRREQMRTAATVTKGVPGVTPVQTFPPRW